MVSSGGRNVPPRAAAGVQGLSRGGGAPRGGRQYHSRNSSAHAGSKAGDDSDNVENDNDNTGNVFNTTIYTPHSHLKMKSSAQVLFTGFVYSLLFSL